MRITVCELPDDPTAFVPAWDALVHSAAGFWAAMFLIVGLIAGLLYLFRRLKWL